MRKTMFGKLSIEEKQRAGLLGAYLDCFVTWMREHDYLPHTMAANIRDVTRFAKYLRRRGVHDIHRLEGVEGQKLLAAYERYKKSKGYGAKKSGIRHYIRILEDAGVCLAPRGPLLFHDEVQQYVSYLKDTRELSETTITSYVHWAEKFLRFLGSQNNASPAPSFGIADVDRFIEQEAVRLNHAPHRSLSVALRSFLRFLYQSGKLTANLSSLVTTPRDYRLKSLPRVLTWGEVRKILDNVDRSTDMGIRDYAILVLLATCGLRGGEVVHLQLNNIDWRKETIHITSRKTRQDIWLPLTPQVGKAILSYLRQGRPVSEYREVFLLTKVPWTPLTGRKISRMVSRRIQSAGFSLPRSGCHLLRHSFATHLIRNGVCLKQIGDLLGHSNPKSTHLYTKTAVENLREAALEVPEVT